MRPAVFLDRDDTLNQDAGYTFAIEDFAWVRGAPEALRLFTEAGLPLLVVTNQGGIARGLFTEADMHRFNSHMAAEAEKLGTPFLDIAFCPHHPDGVIAGLSGPCACRKPAPGMLLELAKRWQIDLSRSVMIGDRQTDVEAGEAAGASGYLFDLEGDLAELARDILNRHYASLAGQAGR